MSVIISTNLCKYANIGKIFRGVRNANINMNVGERSVVFFSRYHTSY